MGTIHGHLIGVCAGLLCRSSTSPSTFPLSPSPPHLSHFSQQPSVFHQDIGPSPCEAGLCYSQPMASFSPTPNLPTALSSPVGAGEEDCHKMKSFPLHLLSLRSAPLTCEGMWNGAASSGWGLEGGQSKILRLKPGTNVEMSTLPPPWQ